MGAQRQRRPHVLMVDDDEEYADDVRAILHGFIHLEHVSSTMAAAASILRSPPDLLWMDLDLPAFFARSGALEGLAFLRRMRSCLAVDVPVLVVSGRLTPQIRQDLEDLGVAACLQKPTDLGDLTRSIGNALGLSSKRPDLRHPGDPCTGRQV